MDSSLRARLITRAHGLCECGCGRPVPPGEVDHFFGKAKAEETDATCWVLTVDCHFEKTRNHPKISVWLERFITHCRKHGYNEAILRAQARLVYADTRRVLGAMLR